MLDFSKFAKARQEIVPILGNRFLLNKKQYRVRSEDGWHLVEITNNDVKVVEAQPPPAPHNNPCYVQGYTHNNTFLFQNYDVAKRKWGLQVGTPLHFNQSGTFEAVIAIMWEDGKAYWAQQNYTDVRAMELKTLLEEGKTLEGVKSVTPELRSAFLFHALEREQMLQMQREAEQKEAAERYMNTIPGRLQFTLDRAGGELVTYSLSGKRIVVEWRVKGGSYNYNSVLDSETWRVVEAGYCMSNDDKRHNLTSLVKTAEMYEDDGLTYITRR